MRAAFLLISLLPLAAPALAAKKPAPASAPGAQQCVADTNVRLVPVDENTLLFRQETGRKGWVNHFNGGRCPGLRPMTTVIIEKFGSQYCRGDHLRTIDPPQSIPGPTCILGDFTPYEEPAPARKGG